MDALSTDLYQLTMAAGYFHRGMTGAQATCEMFVRRLPRKRRYLVTMGAERVLQYLERLSFTEDEIAFLRTVPALRDAMSDGFCDYLRGLRFTGDVDAMPEGTVFFANEPLFRVRAPIVEAQLLETFLLSAVNHASMVASKAARVIDAAGEAGVMEFGTRRTHPAAAVDAARAAYAVGFSGTSNVEAGHRFGIPVLGTAAHMWTMAHASEEAAFDAYVSVFPSASILLIDTYDTERGAARAAAIARDKLKGVRLDSGDLLALSRAVRVILDDHGCKAAKIVASGDLNEHRITELRAAGAPIDLYGVGTDLVTSLDAPALGGVYKLVELDHAGERRPIAKFSEGKGTFPGPHQVYRYRGASGQLQRDLIALAGEAVDPGGEALLVPMMKAGKRVFGPEPLDAVRARVKREMAGLSPDMRAIADPPAETTPFTAEVSPGLRALTDDVRRAFGVGA